MTPLRWDLIVWGGFFTAGFLTLELLPIFWAGCPWTTFTEMVRGGIRWWHPIVFIVAGVLFVLGGHFDLGWRARWLIAVGLFSLAALVEHAASR